MGVLNITPDSFSRWRCTTRICDSRVRPSRNAPQLEAGRSADILDIGGESTRPGATSITIEEELRRILPVIQVLRGKLQIPMSVDTRRAEVAKAALAAGAEILNDVSGLRMDARLGEVARCARAPLILMHMRGTPQKMQQGPFARDVIRDAMSGLRGAVARAKHARAYLNRTSCSIRESDSERSTNKISRFSRDYAEFARLQAPPDPVRSGPREKHFWAEPSPARTARARLPASACSAPPRP